jgi:DNA-binding FadR family transcriptional regulator
LLFEGEAAALAATTMTEAELDRLDALVAEIEDANRDGSGEAPDKAFHLAIAQGTGNGAIVKMIEMLWTLRQTSPECALMFSRARTAGSKPVVAEHAAIAAALRSRDPVAARATMRSHLGRVIDHLLDATEAEAMEKARASVATTRNRFARPTDA